MSALAGEMSEKGRESRLGDDLRCPSPWHQKNETVRLPGGGSALKQCRPLRLLQNAKHAQRMGASHICTVSTDHG